MRDLVSVGRGKVLLGYAGDALLLVDLDSCAVRALAPPQHPEPAPAATPATPTAPAAPASEEDKEGGKKKSGATPSPLQGDGLGQIEAVALSSDGALAAAIYRHKVLALWSTEDGALIVHRVLPKKALALLFGSLRGETVVLVHDKVGDVRAYPANDQLPRRSALLLGHTCSVGTCLALSSSSSSSSSSSATHTTLHDATATALLASGDRDEKVRVSRFPCTLRVQGYLTGHTNFISAVRFLRGGEQILTASGDGRLGMWDAQTCASLGRGAVDLDPSVTTEEAAEGEEGGKEGGSGGVVPLALAVAADGGAAVVSVLGRSELRVFSLPSLALQAVIPTSSPPLGLDMSVVPSSNENKEGEELLFVSVAAPEYLLVFRRVEKRGGTAEGLASSFELVSDHEAAGAVRAFAVARGVGTDVVHAAEDEGLFGGLTKESLTVRHVWNDRKRKEGHKEKQKGRGKRRRARGKGEGAGEKDAEGEEEGVVGGEAVAMET